MNMTMEYPVSGQFNHNHPGDLDYQQFSQPDTSRLGKILVQSLYFVGVPYGYQPMARRAYMTNGLNGERMRNIQNIFQNDMKVAKRIDPTVIAQELSGIIGLRGLSDHTPIIQMPGGWDSSRYRVILKIEVMYGVKKVQYLIQGYTSPVDLNSQYLDENMMIYINSVSEINLHFNARKGLHEYHLGESYSTLKDFCSSQKFPLSQEEQLALIRPTDIMSINSALESNSHSDLYDTYGTHGEPMLLGFGEYSPVSTQTSSRKNLDPNIYLSRILNGYLDGQELASVSWDNTYPELIFKSSGNSVAEQSLLKNVFISRIQEVTNQYSPSELTLRNLYQIDPSLQSDKARLQCFNNQDHGTHIVEKPIELTASTEYTSNTLNPSDRNLRVLELNNMITSHLLSCGLLEVTVFISNYQRDPMTGGPLISFSNGRSIIDESYVVSSCESLRKMIQHFIIPYFSRGDDFHFDLLIESNILKDTTIVISDNTFYGSQEKEIFRFPTYADSLYSPMIATNYERTTLNNDIRSILENGLSTY